MSPKSVALGFIQRVRSGKEPEAAGIYLAPTVKAHQVVSGEQQTIERTPTDYAEHILEFTQSYGSYELQVEETLVEANKVFVRWRQIGKYLSPILGFEPTGYPLVTVGSAVYQVDKGLITEYWIQQENQGLLAQLQHNAALVSAGKSSVCLAQCELSRTLIGSTRLIA